MVRWQDLLHSRRRANTPTIGAGNGALQGLYIGIGFAASHGLVSNLFRAEPLKLFLVGYGQVVSTVVLLGLILGVWA